MELSKPTYFLLFTKGFDKIAIQFFLKFCPINKQHCMFDMTCGNLYAIPESRNSSMGLEKWETNSNCMLTFEEQDKKILSDSDQISVQCYPCFNNRYSDLKFTNKDSIHKSLNPRPDLVRPVILMNPYINCQRPMLKTDLESQGTKYKKGRGHSAELYT